MSGNMGGSNDDVEARLKLDLAFARSRLASNV
jgi:hypothetical protein